MNKEKEINYYEIDWNRVRNIDDIKVILKSFDFIIPKSLKDFKSVMPYLMKKEDKNE